MLYNIIIIPIVVLRDTFIKYTINLIRVRFNYLLILAGLIQKKSLKILLVSYSMFAVQIYFQTEHVPTCIQLQLVV